MSDFRDPDKLRAFLQQQIVTTTEAAEMLGCTRQYIAKLVKSGSLIPLKEGKERLFMKADILQRQKK